MLRGTPRAEVSWLDFKPSIVHEFRNSAGAVRTSSSLVQHHFHSMIPSFCLPARFGRFTAMFVNTGTIINLFKIKRIQNVFGQSTVCRSVLHSGSFFNYLKKCSGESSNFVRG